jgi:type II secretory pathway pseudopilin PulG
MIGGLLSADPDPQKGMAGKLLSGLAVRADGATLRVATAPGGPGLGALAALAVPSLLKARGTANESAAIGDIRTVISAEAAYQSTNKGLYGDIGCLSTPATCVKGYTGPEFIDAELASLAVKTGYKRAFFPGKKGARARSFQGWAYTAVPAEPGKTGTRSFCGEASGVIRVDPQGGDIKPVGGVCPATLEVLK